MDIIHNLANSSILDANYTAKVDNNANDNSFNNETSEQWIATRIHSHFHNNTATNNSDCVQITKLIANYLLIASKNLTSILLDSSNNNLTQQYHDSDNNEKLITNSENQKSALLYIVVVLSFYAFGIGLIMIKYIRQESKEREVYAKYGRDVNLSHEQYLKCRFGSRLANRLALHAMNTVNTMPHNVTHKVTFL